MSIFKNPTKTPIFKNPSPEPVRVVHQEPEIIKEDITLPTTQELVDDPHSSSGKSLVQQAVEAVHTLPNHKPPMLQEKLRDAELGAIRQSIADLVAKVGTLSWGGGGTGVVRFVDLDDHQHPRDIRYLEFHPDGPDIPPPAGSLTWNPIEECLDVVQPDGTTLQAGLEAYIRVHNMSGATLDNGTLVYFAGVDEPHNGSTEHVPTADKFVANNSIEPIYVIGVITESIANGENGRATTFGKVRDIDTTGTSVSETWVRGDLLWAHPTIPGAMTKVRPTAPAMVLSIAAVLHVGASDGVILVRPTIYPVFHFAKFSDSTDQTAALADTPYAVTWDTEDVSCDHIHIDGVNSANIVMSEPGLYDFAFRLQAVSTNSSRSNIWVWARKNGVDVPNSATKMSIESNGGLAAPAWSFVLSMIAGDVFQLMWAVDSTQISLASPSSTAFAPDTPSATLKVTQVAL